MFCLSLFSEYYCYFVLMRAVFLTGLVAKIEKNLTDHTEFLNYKKEMDKWLANANEILDNCAGIGNAEETRRKLQEINVILLFLNFSFIVLLF